jgi:hypothetical protein
MRVLAPLGRRRTIYIHCNCRWRRRSVADHIVRCLLTLVSSSRGSWWHIVPRRGRKIRSFVMIRSIVRMKVAGVVLTKSSSKPLAHCGHKRNTLGSTLSLPPSEEKGLDCVCEVMNHTLSTNPPTRQVQGFQWSTASLYRRQDSPVSIRNVNVLARCQRHFHAFS